MRSGCLRMGDEVNAYASYCKAFVFWFSIKDSLCLFLKVLRGLVMELELRKSLGF